MKILKRLSKSNKNITFMLSVISILSLLTCVYNAHQYTKSINELTDRFAEVEINEEPDVLESDLPHEKLGKFELTFYTATGNRTATGTKPKSKRTIAVDPRKIPLGSIVYIQDYGYFIAEDTGGVVKGNIIDVYMDSKKEALQKGRKIANVYLLR